MKHTTVPRRARLAGVALSALLLTAACGDGDHMGGTNHGGAPAAAGAPASTATGFNDADVMFAQMMIPHHEQAVTMADLAPGRAADPELKELAAKIKAAQGPEIVTMTGWLTAWGRPTALPEGHDMHGSGSAMPGGGGMSGMASGRQMDALKAADGVEFDRMFAELMIGHHNGAIEMAKVEQADGANSEAKALAGRIAAEQAAEVRTLRSILDRL